MVILEILLTGVLLLVIKLKFLHFCYFIPNFKYNFLVQRPVYDEPKNPCYPSPCGLSATCVEINGNPSCSCLSEYIGTPPNCRPECTSNSDCSYNKACINRKCQDPCVNSCGFNAECRVVHHNPNCACASGYTGNPFTECYIIQQSKCFFLNLCVFVV